MQLEDGIYFDLPEEIYFKVEALGSTDLMRMRVSPATFWNKSWLNEERKDEEPTDAQVLGRAYHCARLEPDRFALDYVRQPVKDDYDKKALLTSDAAVKAELKKLGETQALTGEGIPERAERLVEAGYKGTIWPLLMHRFEKGLKGRTPISGDRYDEILVDIERMAKSEAVHYLRGGFSEVSVIWTDKKGIRRRARFDRLKADGWSDLKTFSNPNGKHVRQAITDAFRYNRYYIQIAQYREAFEEIPNLPIIGEATEEQKALRQAIVDLGDRPPVCHYVFQEKDGIPNLFAFRFKFSQLDVYREHEIEAMLADEDKKAIVKDALSSETMIWRRAKIETARALSQYEVYSQVYARGEPWAPFDAVTTIGDEDFNKFWLEGE